MQQRLTGALQNLGVIAATANSGGDLEFSHDGFPSVASDSDTTAIIRSTARTAMSSRRSERRRVVVSAKCPTG